MRAGTKRSHRAPPYAPGAVEEGGRHWTDDEVRALLCVWADRRIRERLKYTLRNKSIFQEMARQMQRSFGVVRNWKQCRTKYKNLKYDYKTARSAHAAGGGGGPGKYMKFFDEVEAILLDRGPEDGAAEMQRKLYDGGLPAARPQTQGAESEVVIEIDDGKNRARDRYRGRTGSNCCAAAFLPDDNSDDYDVDGDVEAKWRTAGKTWPDTSGLQATFCP